MLALPKKSPKVFHKIENNNNKYNDINEKTDYKYNKKLKDSSETINNITIVNKLRINNNMSLSLLIIIERIIYSISSESKFLNVNFHIYKIILKIKGIGPNKIFGFSFHHDNYPYKIFINEDNQNIVNYMHNFTKNVNLIRLE